MSDTASLKKQLKIKAGVVKRLNKEQNLYRKESEEQRVKLDKFIANKAEDWDINNGRRMLEESEKMIVDATTRLGKAVQDLRQLIITARKNPALTSDEDFLKAEEELEAASM